jgi:hypothetical protein
MATTLNAKRLQILLDVVRNATTVGYLLHRDTKQADLMVEQIRKTTQSLGRRLTIAAIGAESDLADAFATFKQTGNRRDALRE